MNSYPSYHNFLSSIKTNPVNSAFAEVIANSPKPINVEVKSTPIPLQPGV